MCLRKVIAAEPIEQKLRKSLGRNIAPHDFESAITEGLAQGIVNDIEARTVREAMELTTLVIQVDEFGEHRLGALEVVLAPPERVVGVEADDLEPVGVRAVTQRRSIQRWIALR